MKTSNDILRKMNDYQSRLSFDTSCPEIINFLSLCYMDMENYIESGRADAAEGRAYSAIGALTMLTARSQIESKEFIKLFNKARDFIDLKQSQAIAEDKKILVVLGEIHGTQQSLLLEFAILSYLKTQGFKSILSEATPEGLQKRIEDLESDRIAVSVTGGNLGFSALGYKLKAIDSAQYKEVSQHSYEYKFRVKDINHNVALNSGENQVLIIGSSHIRDLFKSTEVTNKFTIAAINVGNFKHTPYSILKFMDSDPIRNALKLDFSDCVESFSANNILDIARDMLPYFLGEKTQSKNVIYESDNEQVIDNCDRVNLVDRVMGRVEDYLDSI